MLMFAAAFVLPLIIPILVVQKWGWRGLLSWYAFFACFCVLCALAAPRFLGLMILPWMMAGPPFLFATLAGGLAGPLVVSQLLIGVLIAGIAKISGRLPRSKKA